MRKGWVAALLYTVLGTASTGWGQTTYFGNQAVVNLAAPSTLALPSFAFTDFPLNSPTARADFRFTAQQSAPITEVQLYVPGIVPAVQPYPTYSFIVSVQPDSGGSPSGTVLGANTAFPALIGWDDIPLAAPSSVTAGNVYHLVVTWNKFSPINVPNATNYPLLRLSSQPDYYFYPQSGTPDSQLATAEDPGTGAWTQLAEEPVFLVNYSGIWSGNPYATVNSPGVRFGINPTAYWETFTAPTTEIVDTVGTYTGATGGLSASASLLYSLTASNAVSFGATLAQGTLAVPGQLPAGLAWVDVPTAPITFVPGVNYTLTFSSSAAGSIPYYLLDESPQASNIGAGFNVFENVSYGGAGSYEGNPAVIFCGLCPSVDLNYADDLPFRFSIVKAPSPTPTGTPAFTLGCQDSLFVSRNVYRPKTDNPPLTIQTNLCGGGKYSIKLYNSAGEYICTLRDNPNQPAGADQVTWDGKNSAGAYVASGIYIIYMTSPQSVHQAKLVVLE